MAPTFPSRALLLTFVLVVTITFVTSSPLRKREFPSLDGNQQGGIFSVLGIAGLGDPNDTTVYPRLEIRQLEKNTVQWNVFLLGLQRFQNVSQEDKLSYFQIAGIHGRPWVAWDGVEGDPDEKSQHNGYCQHGNTMFPTWHRPYLALFEEVLYLNARQVILEWPNGTFKDTHMAALTSLRLPYWDWAAVPPANEGSMPWSIQRPTIPITLPSGPSEITNPLASYHFHPTPEWPDEGDQRWKAFSQTYRHPTTRQTGAISQNGLVANTLDRNRQSMQNRVYNLLAMTKDYMSMSNKYQPGDSLESIHGIIHDTVGGDGHMLWLQYSAFDPAFWFHHANVDRLIAIWQEVVTQTVVDGQTCELDQQHLIYFLPPTDSSPTALKPFHSSDTGDFWTSDSVRHWQTFGYTYLAVQNLTDTDTIVSRVNALYGTSARPMFSDPLSVYASPQSSHKRSISISGASTFASRRQYTVNIRLHEVSFDGSLKFYFFFGEPVTGDAVDWVDEQGFIGVTSVLAASVQGGNEINTVVPLTAALEARVRILDLPNMEEAFVDDYLTGNLRWKIVQVRSTVLSQYLREKVLIRLQANGDVLDSESIPGIQLSVLWQEVEPAKSTLEFPSLRGALQTLKEASEDEVKAGEFCKPTLDSISLE
ncbi:Di-copper centre-containing protein [Massarina eburnea CBS 473.64]|uniref:tyrosinase n=1 Tax=Massarina eburnea CBS 473.64 TaxID=1395130 RepID=A0A6A6RWM4_9PLEO|nr:Di-copper centre-containing protein [Massarina eburnea CBS 473.64]